MQENSAPIMPVVNSAPADKHATPGSMKSGFSCSCNNSTSTATEIHNPYGFGKLLLYYCNSKESPISLSQVLHVVGAEFTTGAEFSRIYGMHNSQHSCLNIHECVAVSKTPGFGYNHMRVAGW